MSLDTLPPEIIELVVSFVDRQELKSLRETNSAFLEHAGSRLFGEIHISPNSHSFDRALAIANSENLRQLVRSLVYHFGMLGDFYPGFETFRHEYFSVRNPGESRNPSEVTAEVLWCYNCWLEELDGQRTFELRDEEEELQQLCSRLPELERISTLLDDIDDITEPKDYIGVRTGMITSEHVGECRFARLFRSTAGKSLTKIAARSIGWNDLEDLVQASEGNVAIFEELVLPSTLRYLELGLYNPMDQRSMTNMQARCEWLHVFLSRASSLTTLRLDFDELPFESCAELMLPISKTIFSRQWPQLKEMKLEAIAAYEDELCEFLFAHVATLHALQLGDIELVEPEDCLQSPSILRLFRRLQKGLRLQSFRITGNFTNRTTQAWYVDIEEQHVNCLRDLIEDFVCSRPIAYQDTTANEGETKRCIEESYPFFSRYMHNDRLKTEDWEEFSDPSWYWSPELLPEEEV